MSWDLQVAARTLWGEVRGEPEEGQRAVAHVLWNRLRTGRWGKNLALVCMKRKQFSCWNDDDPQRDRMAAITDDDVAIQKYVALLLATKHAADDPVEGALFYFSDSMKDPPSWAASMKFVRKIGHHAFYTDRP